MRLTLSLLLAITCSVAYSQPYAGSREAAENVARAMSNSLATRQYTKQTIHEWFIELGKYSARVEYPTLQLNSLSRVGHLGVLDTDGVDYWVGQRIKEGILIDVDYYSGPSKVSRFLFKNSDANKDIPTGGLADVRGAWHITGTFTYPTLLDANHTILVVEPLPQDEVPLPERPTQKFLMNMDYVFRDWHNKDDSLFHRGIYIGYRDKHVWIMDNKSDVVKKNLFELSVDDQKFVRSEIQKGRKDHLIPEYLRGIEAIDGE